MNQNLKQKLFRSEVEYQFFVYCDKLMYDYWDGESSTTDLIESMCEDNNISTEIVDWLDDVYFKQGAAEAGIPWSVITGQKALNEVFSQDYIQWKLGKGFNND